MWYSAAELGPRERDEIKKCRSCFRPFELVVDQELLPRIETLL